MMVEHNQSANNPTNNGYDNKFKFNGKELDDATQMYYYGARYYDPRISIFVSVDPLAEKFPNYTPYNYTLNNPIRYIDPDGRAPEDIIILGNSAGASGLGHQAVLIGDEKKGWVYISKDGAAKSGGYKGTSRFTVAYYKTLDDFSNSSNNFETAEGVNHSNIGGGENTNPKYALDSDFNKIQRYDQAYRIKTDGANDMKAIAAGVNEAKKDYHLMISDCSDVPTAVLKTAKGPNGEKLNTGESNGGLFRAFKEGPNSKQSRIESRNSGKDYDTHLFPSSYRLKKEQGESGIRQN